MRIVTIKIKGLSPYSGSQHPTSERDEAAKESHEAFEARVWREKQPVNAKGNAVIPAMAFHGAIVDAAARLQLSVPGKGAQKMTKNFRAGIMFTEDVEIEPQTTRAQLESIVIYANLDGRKGGSKRGNRWFPMINNWTATLVIHVLDDEITEDAMELVVTEAGIFCGVGRWRPAKGGLNGRWEVESITWSGSIKAKRAKEPKAA